MIEKERTTIQRLFEGSDAPWVYHVLLVALFLSFALMPFEESLPFGHLIIRAIYAALIMGALVLVSNRPLLLVMGLVLLFPSPLVRAFGVGGTTSVIVADMATVGLIGFVIVILLARLLRHPVITLATVSGMTSVYLLIGVAWMLMFLLLETIQPCSFNGVECDPTAVPGDEPHSGAFNALFYFSFVTISTLGYGDVTPASDATRVLAAMEAVVGQLFLVVLLARMVGLMGRRTTVAVGDT